MKIIIVNLALSSPFQRKEMVTPAKHFKISAYASLFYPKTWRRDLDSGLSRPTFLQYIASLWGVNPYCG